MHNANDIFQTMENDIQGSNLDEATKSKMLQNVMRLKKQKINLMITGATGSGKSSTINAMFNTEKAKVGIGVDPETMEISKFELNNLILWDTPGLGDGKEKDITHSKTIIKKLNELDENNNPLIDLVLVVLDGSTRDLGTSYELINGVIIPNLGDNPESRIIVAINQADVAMKGRYWDYTKNKPEKELIKFLDEKVESIKRRIKEATGVSVEPIYYSAGYKEANKEQIPYNLSKLLYLIVKNTPTKKRLSYVSNINSSDNLWTSSDGLKNYREEVQKSFAQTVVEYAGKGADVGASIGSVFGKTGETIGRVVGGVAGALLGGFKSLIGW